MSELPAAVPARPTSRFEALVRGESAGQAALAAAAGLFALYRFIDLTQAQLKAHGWVLTTTLDVGAARLDLFLSYAVGAVALAVYLLLIAIVTRGRIDGHYRSAVLALGFGAHLGVLLTSPALSLDAFSYIAHGGVALAVPGGTPYSHLPEVVSGTPIGDQLRSMGWAPPPMVSPYGPIWSLIEVALARFAPSVALGVVGVKVIAFLSAMGSAWLIWRILGIVRPARQLAGTVIYLWNPLVFVELSIEGHNDGLMAFFTLLGIYLLLRARTAPSIVAAAAGVLTKWVTALIVPPAAVYAWRTTTDRRRLLTVAAVGALGALALAVITFAPVWNGWATFEGVSQSGKPGGYATLPGAIYRILAGLPGLEGVAGSLGLLIPSLIFLGYLAFESWKVRDVRTMLAATAWISLAYLLLARGLYYPWYAVIPISLLALLPERRYVAMLVVATVVGRLVAPLVDLHESVYLIPFMAFEVTNLGTYATLLAFVWFRSRPDVAWSTATDAAMATQTDGVPTDAPSAAPMPVASATAGPAGAHEAVDAAGAPTPKQPLIPPAVGATLDRVGAAIRSDEGPRTLAERLLLVALVAIPMIATGVALLPEILVRVPSMNDDMLHWLFIQNANDALDRGANLLDHWLPQIETGVPQFLYYQHLAPLIVVALGRLTGGLVDLFDVFNIVRWVLLVSFPLTVVWSMRRMGFSIVVAAFAGAASCLLAGGALYGFEYDSYVWRGWGLFTQLLAMHLSFIVLATAYRAITTGKGLVVAAIAFAALVLAHLIYAYMMAITLVVVVLVGIGRANAGARILRFGLVASIGAAISAYMWLPFVLQSDYLNASPYLQPYKYDGYGAQQVVEWLLGGKLFDVGRAPILTGLFALGIVGALVSRARIAVFAVVLAAAWLVIYSGRPTLGELADLLPLSRGLLFHRFIGSVDLAAIVLMGIGGAVAWTLVFGSGNRNAAAMGALLLVLVLLPTLRERLDYYALNRTYMERSAAAVANDTDAQAIIAKLETLPPGRIWAGIPQTYADEIKLDQIPFADLFIDRAITALPQPTESMSLNSDLIWNFDEESRTSYELFNARYVVAPASREMPDFLTRIMTAGRYALYEAPTSGYGQYVRIVDWSPIASAKEWLTRNRAWAMSHLPADRVYAAFDFPSAESTPARALVPGCADGGTVAETSVTNDGYTFDVSCDMDSAFVIKATYHPNWEVLVDGRPAETFMASPSYLGVRLPSGSHTVVATYRAHPFKTPLALAGLAILGAAFVLRRRIEAIPDAVLALVGRLRDTVEAQLEKERLAAEAEKARRAADQPGPGADARSGADA